MPEPAAKKPAQAPRTTVAGARTATTKPPPARALGGVRTAATRATGRRPTVRRAAQLAADLVILVRDSARSRARAKHPVEVARMLEPGANGDGLRLVLESGRQLRVPATWWEEVHSDLRDLVREELAPLDADARQAVLETLVDAAAGHDRCSLELSGALHGIREVLRERLPLAAVDQRQPAGLSVEQILAVDDRAFWISGWMHDEDGRGAVTLVSPESVRVPLLGDAFRYERPDVVQFYSPLGPDRTRDHGFTACFTLPAASLLSRGWIAELSTGGGLHLEIQCPQVVEDAESVRSAILGELSSRGPIGGELVAAHGRHALTRLQRRIAATTQTESVDVYGTPPPSPATSVVVPLYKRLDLIEHQLLQFARDRDFTDTELIYVLDSVEQTDELARAARELYALYGLPFKVVNLSSPAGFAGATNQGVAEARAGRLLLLNSDVIPDRPGWIGAMGRFYDATDGIGALGPKLLYEDDSLQHAGLYFHRAPGTDVWENAHCFKGLHRSFPAANVARRVPAVTAACMMVDRDLYEQVEGLPLHYVQGDYEDSELCLRLAQAGRRNWYLPSVELYHLEGQSYVPGVRRVPSEYNMWLHSAMWGEAIAAEMARFDPHAAIAAGDGGGACKP